VGKSNTNNKGEKSPLIDNSFKNIDDVIFNASNNEIIIDAEFTKGNGVNKSNNHLSKSKEYFEAIFNYAADGILVGDSKGEIIDFNRSFADLTGYTKETLLNKHITQLFPKDVLTVKPINFEGVDKGESIVNERHIIDATGNRILIEMNTRQFGDNGYLSIIRDLREREKVRNELRESVERNHLLADLSLDGLLIHENGIIVEVNRALTNMFGYERSELVGECVIDKLTSVEYKSVLLNKLKNPSSEVYEGEGIRKTGEKIHIELEGRDIYFNNRQMRVVSVRNVSFRKKVEAVYSLSLEINKLIEKYDPDYIIKQCLLGVADILNSESAFVCFGEYNELVSGSYWVNENGEILVKADCVSKNGLVLDTTKGRTIHINNCNKKFVSPQEINLNIERYMVMPYYINGQIMMMLGVLNSNQPYSIHDESIFKVITDNLWSVLERYSLQDKLRVANESKDKFLSIIAHDLKSPLSSVASMTDLLNTSFSDFDSNSIHEYIGLISETSKSTLSLLNNLLNWAKAQTNKIVINREKLSFGELLNEEFELLKQVAENKKLTVDRMTDENITMLVDKNTMSTVIRNLLSNAIKFTPKCGKIEVSISNYKNGLALIAVKDSGIGIAEQEKDMLFDEGKSFHKLGTENEKGSGLGLLLCKEFVHKNGGKIWVESEVGKGSAFFVTVPCL